MTAAPDGTDMTLEPESVGMLDSPGVVDGRIGKGNFTTETLRAQRGTRRENRGNSGWMDLMMDY